MKRIIAALFTAAILIMALPAYAETSDQPLPDLTSENTSGYTATFYGSTGVQEAWLLYEARFDESDPGYILGVFDQVNLTPLRSYFWGRVRGDVEDNTPSQSDDYVAGMEFLLKDITDNSILYLAEESVVFTTSFRIDRAYTGLGLRWTGDDITVDGSGWYDIDDNFRFSVAAAYNPYEDLYFEPSVWIMIDNAEDTWAWWRLTTTYTLSEDLDMIGFYEDSTRSDPQFMLGLGHSF